MIDSVESYCYKRCSWAHKGSMQKLHSLDFWSDCKMQFPNAKAHYLSQATSREPHIDTSALRIHNIREFGPILENLQLTFYSSLFFLWNDKEMYL